MVVPDLVQAGRRCISGDVAADAHAGAVGTGNHDRGVPPDVGADAPLHVLVAGEPRLALRRDRVDVVGAAQPGYADLLLPGSLQQAQHHVPGTRAAAGPDDRVKGLDPLPGLVLVNIRQLGGQAVADNREALASGGHGVSSPSTGAGNPAPELVVWRWQFTAGLRSQLSRPILLRDGRRRISTGQ